MNELHYLNSLLLTLKLLPVASTVSLANGTDASLAQLTLRTIIEREMAKGWYLFNRFDCVEVMPTTDGTIVVDQPLTRWSFSDRSRRSYWNPPNRMLMSADRMTLTDTSGVVAQLGTAMAPLWLDVVYRVEPFDPTTGLTTLDDAFLSHCVALTAEQMGPLYGIVMDKSETDRTFMALLAAEEEASPNYNLFEDNIEIAHTWKRR